MLSKSNYGAPPAYSVLLMLLIVGGVVIFGRGSSGVRSKSKRDLEKILVENLNLVNMGRKV